MSTSSSILYAASSDGIRFTNLVREKVIDRFVRLSFLSICEILVFFTSLQTLSCEHADIRCNTLSYTKTDFKFRPIIKFSEYGLCMSIC